MDKTNSAEVEHLNAMKRLEAEYKRAPAKFKQRVEAYMLRLQGYHASEIAKKLHIALPTVWGHWKWCQDNLPSIADSAHEFIRISIDRLEVQYRQLEELRADGDPGAHRASVAIVEAQAKLLGVYNITLDVTSKVSYQIEGVDMDQV